jgi:hypothetical protein
MVLELCLRNLNNYEVNIMREIIFLNERDRMTKELLSGRLPTSKATREEVLRAGASSVGERAG